jgi:hypothetical protein
MRAQLPGILSVAALVLATACASGGSGVDSSGGKSAQQAAAAKAAPATPAPAATAATASSSVPDADLQVRLVAADRADGTEDKVISSCAPCGLGMKGSPDHAATAEGYTFHLCSDACKKTLESDPKKVIALLPAS